MSEKKLLIPGINHVSNQEYHSDKRYFSSSGLKLATKDPILFYKKYIRGDFMYEHKPAFDLGTYLHTLILEPHLVDEEFVFGKRITLGSGVDETMQKQMVKEDYIQKKAENPGKIVLKYKDKAGIDRLYKSYLKDKPSVKLIEGCEYEYTIAIDQANQFSSVPVKIRTDAINLDKGYIADVKSTSMKLSVSSYKDSASKKLEEAFYSLGYHVSAAMYIDVVKQYYKKDFDFYFIVASKTDCDTISLKASKKFLDAGYTEYLNALEKVEEALKDNGIMTL